jgi:hypothetical protein
MDPIKLEFDIGTTDAECELGVKVSIDGNVIYNNPYLVDPYHVSHDISDEEGEHELTIELYGKLPQHTKIDDQGNIVKDTMITVENIKIDDIDLSTILMSAPLLIQYHHDFNGTQPAVVDSFYGSMGCNGIVTLKFATPIYLWLLENM